MPKKRKVTEPLPETDPIVAEWVCAGERMLEGGKTAVQWYPLHDGAVGAADDYRLYSGVNGVVGGVYRVTYFEQEAGAISLYTKGAKAPQYLRGYENRRTIDEWRVEHEKAQAAKRRVAAERKMKKDGDRYDGLEPFAKAYANADRYGRAAIVANIAVYLERRSSEIRADAFEARHSRRG